MSVGSAHSVPWPLQSVTVQLPPHVRASCDCRVLASCRNRPVPQGGKPSYRRRSMWHRRVRGRYPRRPPGAPPAGSGAAGEPGWSRAQRRPPSSDAASWGPGPELPLSARRGLARTPATPGTRGLRCSGMLTFTHAWWISAAAVAWFWESHPTFFQTPGMLASSAPPPAGLAAAIRLAGELVWGAPAVQTPVGCSLTDTVSFLTSEHIFYQRRAQKQLT